MTKEEQELTCKWTDKNGVVHNPTKKECYECYECKNNASGKIIMRLKNECIMAEGNDKETQGSFNKYSASRRCVLF
jgi:hypothetical protein